LEEFAQAENDAPRATRTAPPVATGSDRYRHPVATGGDRYGRPVATGGDRYRRQVATGGDCYEATAAMGDSSAPRRGRRGRTPGNSFDDEPTDFAVRDPAGKRFMRDLLGSFALMLEPGNLVTLLIIAFLHIWMGLMGYGLLLGFIGRVILGGYLCAYYLSVITETAGGEDDLPSMRVTSLLDDILIPLFQMLGTALLAMSPALVVWIGSLIYGQEVSSTTYKTLIITGVFFWPAIVLIVAIASSIRGLWPHTVIRTALAAPLAYLLLWVFLLIPRGAEWVIERNLPALTGNVRAAIGFSIASALWSAVTYTLAMRAIGLYYRHFKHRFPWAAE